MEVWQKNTSLAIIVRLFAREYTAWAKSLGSAVKHHGVEVPNEEIYLLQNFDRSSPCVALCP